MLGWSFLGVALFVVLVGCWATLQNVEQGRAIRVERELADLFRPRQCLVCAPWDGFLLGEMRADGSFETHTCTVCKGTGVLG